MGRVVSDKGDNAFGEGGPGSQKKKKKERRGFKVDRYENYRKNRAKQSGLPHLQKLAKGRTSAQEALLAAGGRTKEIKFDEKARKEYLTTLHKKKNERRVQAIVDARRKVARDNSKNRRQQREEARQQYNKFAKVPILPNYTFHFPKAGQDGKGGVGDGEADDEEAEEDEEDEEMSDAEEQDERGDTFEDTDLSTLKFPNKKRQREQLKKLTTTTVYNVKDDDAAKKRGKTRRSGEDDDEEDVDDDSDQDEDKSAKKHKTEDNKKKKNKKQKKAKEDNSTRFIHAPSVVSVRPLFGAGSGGGNTFEFGGHDQNGNGNEAGELEAELEGTMEDNLKQILQNVGKESATSTNIGDLTNSSKKKKKKTNSASNFSDLPESVAEELEKIKQEIKGPTYTKPRVHMLKEMKKFHKIQKYTRKGHGKKRTYGKRKNRS